jgi:hypothetical protein
LSDAVGWVAGATEGRAALGTPSVLKSAHPLAAKASSIAYTRKHWLTSRPPVDG